MTSQSPLRSPKFLYFDLGNVLLFFDHAIACRQMADVAGVTPERVHDVVFGGDLEAAYERGEIDGRGFYEQFCEQTGTRADFDALLHAASAIFWPNRSITPLVAHLNAAGYRLGILSNTCDAHWQYIARRYWIVGEPFEIHALSFELGCMKPDPQTYRAAADLANTSPADIFFVDDRPENVAAAAEAGFDAVLYEGVPQLARDLLRRGVVTNF